MTDIEEIINELDESGVDLFEIPLDKIKVASVCDGNGNRIIGVDIKKFDCSAEIKTALLHEQGHCETYSFYSEHTPKLMRSKLEHRADRYVADNKIKKQDIIMAHERGGIRRSMGVRRVFQRDRRVYEAAYEYPFRHGVYGVD
jgi:hypothetical protein